MAALLSLHINIGKGLVVVRFEFKVKYLLCDFSYSLLSALDEIKSNAFFKTRFCTRYRAFFKFRFYTRYHVLCYMHRERLRAEVWKEKTVGPHMNDR